MQLKIIKTKKDYLLSLERFEEIFQAKTGSKESEEADVIALLIKQYEDKHFVIQAPDPLKNASPKERAFIKRNAPALVG